ncbi:amidohydrolase family protein [Micromonospora sp. NPDC047465]|uniref:amidohydrolase family protein n=1 Tax=Micromonospora sp. NPDC047465 TaxID=3154813 RepID=UPI0033CD7306
MVRRGRWRPCAPSPCAGPSGFRCRCPQCFLRGGIPIGLGTDGIRDLWSPYGDGDMLRIALGFARLHGLRTDDDLADAVKLATTDGARFVHRTGHDLVPGARADIVLLDAENVPDALMRAPRRQAVIAGGRLVVRDGELLV